jgi:cholesterol transport system auxiliary component
MIRPLLRLAALGACGLALGGCISLLPKSKPAQLYRFGQPATAEAPAARAASVGVFRANGGFQRESAGDRLLTITGDRVAYIAQARWVAPAEVLFQQSVSSAFDNASGRVRLISRGEPAHSDYVMRLDVRNFEARYDDGPQAAPTVLVRVRAAITHDGNRVVIDDQVFEARVRADDNRVGAIVAAYDRALAEVLGKLVAWTNQKTTA